MKQQVFAIHGGTSFDTYEDYLSFLKTRDISLEKLKQPDDWKPYLANDLGDDFEVLIPKMPNGANAKYLEWQIWFERCTELMQDDVILIGHSLGGIFLAKYLAENNFPKKIKATFLVAAPFNDTDTLESLKEFVLPESLDKFSNQGGEIYLIHSKDDPVVPVEQVEEYRKGIPEAKIMIFKDKAHFNQRHFPELVELIRSL